MNGNDIVEYNENTLEHDYDTKQHNNNTVEYNDDTEGFEDDIFFDITKDVEDYSEEEIKEMFLDFFSWITENRPEWVEEALNRKVNKK